MQKKVLPNVKMYKRRMNIFWWVNRWIHLKFIARELTSVCVAIYVLLLLSYVGAILSGSDAFETSSSTFRSPLWIIIHVLLLGGLVFHSITWFNLAPKAMVVKMGNKSVPGVIIVLLNYAGWLVISAGLIGLVLMS
jgi:fumarate reductase subunit C